MKRNLYYNCCPFAASEEEWRDNIRMLCRYGDIFNGRRIVVVRTGDRMANPEGVERAFTEHSFFNVEYRLRPNDPVLHETANFIETLEDLYSLDANETTFYAHTKGVRYAKADGLSLSEPTDTRKWGVRQWRNRMYHECLHDIPKVDAALSRYPAAGCFLMQEGLAEKRVWTKWMFCGTFFWFNHAALFSKDNWRFIGPHPDRSAVENYPGAHFDIARAFSFYTTHPLGGALYQCAVALVQCQKCKQISEVSVRSVKKHRLRCCGIFSTLEILCFPELGSAPRVR